MLRVEAVGLCGSDVAQHRGDRLMPTAVFPVVPGHEIVGRVWRLAPDAALGVAEGDRVAVNEVISYEPLRVYGYTESADGSPGLFGGYGEYLVVLPGTELLPLPGDRPAADLTVFEPLANAVNWVDLVDVRPDDVVVLQGPGHQGLAVLEALKAKGAGTVYVTGTADDALRLEAARAMGATEAIDITAVDPLGWLAERTGGRLADVVFDVSPAPATVPLAVDLVATGGRVLLAGLKHFVSVGVVTDLIVLKGVRVQGGSGFTADSMRRAAAMLRDGTVDPGHLRGEVFEFDELETALALLARQVPGRDAVRVTLQHAT